MISKTNRVKKIAVQLGGGHKHVDAMLARQNMTGLTMDKRVGDAGVFGVLGGLRLPKTGNILVFTGEPIRVPEVGSLNSPEDAVRLFAQCDGAFAGFFWDDERQVLVVATDCLGMQPLYMEHAVDGLTLVSETKAVEGEPDPAAWGAFLSLGHPIGDRSLIRGLRRVPPASVLVYECAKRSLTVRRYWEWPASSAAWRHYDFLGALEADVQAYSRLGLSATLLLSGGFDSRLILFLLKRAGLPTDSLIVAHEDEHQDADGRLAEQIARITGTPYSKVQPPADFFSSAAYLEYLAANDMGFPSLDLFIAKVAAQIQSEAVWDGLAPGFVFMPLHQPQGGFEAYLQQEIRGDDSGIWQAARVLFRPEVVEAMYEGFREDLWAEVEALPQNTDGLARFVIENRARNRAGMNPLKVYSNRTAAFTPGVSKDFMYHAATIPFERKQQGRFYLELFRKLDSRALKVPFLSGGQLMAPKRYSAPYYREHIRNRMHRYRIRHPRAFNLGRRVISDAQTQRSMFLNAKLLEDDPWINPAFMEQLRTGKTNDYRVWKLLFHWKAWLWLHRDRLDILEQQLAR